MAHSIGKFPQHIGIIMDGNGRWAQSKGKPRIFGHIKGARVAKKIITESVKLGVKNLTLYAFSTENWLRPAAEVNFLMGLLQRYLRKELNSLMKQNIRFRAIGDLSKLPKSVLAIVHEVQDKTANNSGLTLQFAISYGSRWEIARAAQKIARAVQSGEVALEDVNETLFAQNLTTSSQPDPDLIIRTSGETRLSNFLLWQAAYAELSFSRTLWPDFTVNEYRYIINDFQNRNRRFGTVERKNEDLHN